MARDMPSTLLQHWETYHRLEPFGQPWQNWLMAVPARDFAQAHSKEGTVITVQDYLYEDKQTKKERETANLFAWFDAKVDNGR